MSPPFQKSRRYVAVLLMKENCHIATDVIFNLPSASSRKAVLSEYRNTNYGVVNPRTIDAVNEAQVLIDLPG